MSESRLRRLIEERAASIPDVAYVEDARSERAVTYSELELINRQWASILTTTPERGTVLLDLADSLNFATAFIGVIAAGRCAVPVDPAAPDGEKARLRQAVGADVVVREEGGLPAAAEIVVGSDGRLPIEAVPASTPGPGRLRLHTSGSTGEPKAVELSEDQLLYVATQVAEHNRLAPGERGYNSLPLFHINAEVVGLLATLVGGATLVLDRKFGRRDFWALMTRRRITWINAVPALLAILARDELPARPDGLRFIRSASASLAPSVREAFQDAFGPVVVESYGMTEAASQITATALPPESSPTGSVGRPLGVDLQLRTADGDLVTDGGVGRIWLRGPGVITGYVDGRAADRFDADGWLDTGDLGQLDADGNLTHIGRADDVINRGGELVHPREIEEVLLADDRVTDAVVLGRPDDVLGEVPVAYVVTTAEPDELRPDLLARCESELSRYKRPVELIFVGDLPRAATGKIRRGEVADTATAARP